MDRLAERLRSELPGYDISRRMSRGTRRGQVRLVFTVQRGEGMRWLHFAPSRSKFLYHSHQGWSGLLDVRIGEDDWRGTHPARVGGRCRQHHGARVAVAIRIRQALDETDWNVAAAARRLGAERTSLHKRIRALGLARRK